MKSIYLLLLASLCLGNGRCFCQYSDLMNFNGSNSPSGAFPGGSLILSGNVLYGMTSEGGANNDGNIFSVHLDGSGFKDLYDFKGTPDGANPNGSLILLGNMLYGMTEAGGTSGKGSIFTI